MIRILPIAALLILLLAPQGADGQESAGRKLTTEEAQALAEKLRKGRPGQLRTRIPKDRPLTTEEAEALARELAAREHVSYEELSRIQQVEKKLKQAYRQTESAESTKGLTHNRTDIEEALTRLGEEQPAGNAYLSSVIQYIGGSLYQETELQEVMDTVYESYRKRLRELIAEHPDGKGIDLSNSPEMEADFDRIDKRLVDQCMEQTEYDGIREFMKAVQREGEKTSNPEAQEDFRELVRRLSRQEELEQKTGHPESSKNTFRDLRQGCMRILSDPSLGARRVHAETRLNRRYRQAVHESAQPILRRLFSAFKKATRPTEGESSATLKAQRVHGLVIRTDTSQADFVGFLCRLAGRDGRSRRGDRLDAEERPDFIKDLKNCAPWKPEPLIGGPRYVHERHRWEHKAGQNQKMAERYEQYKEEMDKHAERAETLHRKAGQSIEEARQLIAQFEAEKSLRTNAIDRLRQDTEDLAACHQSGRLADQSFRKDLDEHYFTLTTTREERLEKEGRLQCRDDSEESSENPEETETPSLLERITPDWFPRKDS